MLSKPHPRARELRDLATIVAAAQAADPADCQDLVAAAIVTAELRRLEEETRRADR